MKSAASTPRNGALRFLRHLVSALVVIVAATLLGIGIEHTSLSQTIANSFNSSQTQLIFRGGKPYEKDIVSIGTQRTVTLHPITLPKGVDARTLRSETGSESPADLTMWPQLVETLALVAALACAAAGFDLLRRAILRRRRFASR
jgi:hypothetical protein